jgi:O-antigen/teichoic acid export membrane protein
MARILGPAGLGSWLVARTVAFDLGSVLARCGLDEAVLRFVARSHGRREPAHARGVVRSGLHWSLLTALAAGVMLFAVAPAVGARVFKKPEVAQLMRALAPSLLLWAPVVVLLAAVQGLDRVAIRVAAQKIAFPGIQAVVLGIALAAGLGMGGVVAAHYTGIIAMVIVAATAGLHAWRTSAGRGAGVCHRSELARFAAPLALNELSMFAVLWLDILMLGAMSSRSETGVYGAAQRVTGLIALPLNAVNMMFSPVIASLHGTGDRDGLAELLRVTARWVLFATIPLFAVVLYAGKEILGLFGEGFQAGYPALVVLSAGKLVSSATGSVGYVLNMTGHQRLNLLNSVLLCMINAVLNVLWISRWGAAGAAGAAALSLALINALRVAQVRAVLGMGLVSRGYAVALLGAALAFLVVTVFRGVAHGPLGVAILSVAFIVVYAGTLARWGLNDADREIAAVAMRWVR